MRSCEKVEAIIGNNPDARSRIENAGKDDRDEGSSDKNRFPCNRAD